MLCLIGVMIFSATSYVLGEVDVEDSDCHCRLFMALSTIPNDGIGVFTGVPLKEGEPVGYGDTAIPVTDMDWHNDGLAENDDYHWLWRQYDWNSDEIGKMEFEAETVKACIPGLGAMPNCHFRLSNVEESWSLYDTDGFHRKKDPGVGAFTRYYGRNSTAIRDISEGTEIFVDYGEHWFQSREIQFGLIPMSMNYNFAAQFLKKFSNLHAFRSRWLGTPSNLDEIRSDFWKMIGNFPYNSRSLAALPKTIETVDKALEIGIQETELKSSIRSMDWLRENGKCIDNLRPGISTVAQAGRGAFATRFIPKGKRIAPSPLIHIPSKDTLLMYGVANEQEYASVYYRNSSDIRGRQLLLNYCFGHNESTLLLCPYGSGTSYINHNQQSPNAKIVWPDEAHSLIHKKEWLNESIDFLEGQFYAALEFEYVATRDIYPDEEVFIDYGLEWEDAWNQHINAWIPQTDDDFDDASQWSCFKDCDNATPIRTKEEQNSEPYSPNVEIYCFCSYGYRTESVWKEFDDWRQSDAAYKFPCEILRRYLRQGGGYLYDVELSITSNMANVEGDGLVLVKGVPQYAIQFTNKKYTSDLFLHNAFRHEMMIPNEMFPDSWRNLLV